MNELVKKHFSKALIVKKTIFYTILTFFSLVMLYPLIFMFLAGAFTPEEFWRTELGLFPIPKQPTIENYLALFTFKSSEYMGYYVLNSFGRTGLSAAMTVINTGICGYAFSRLHFRFRKQIFMTMLMISFLPATITLLPTFLLYHAFGIYDTWWVFVIGGFGLNVMGTFVVKQYLDSLPISLDESAKIDGANIFQIIWFIIIPIAKPIFAYIAITTAIGSWNDWFTSFYYTEDPKLDVLPAAITSLAMNADAGLEIPNYPLMITLGLAVTIPSLVIYLIFQQYIIEGLAYVGIKG